MKKTIWSHHDMISYAFVKK